MNTTSRQASTTNVGRDKRSVPGDSERRQRRCAAYAGLRSTSFFSPLPLRERSYFFSLSLQGRGRRKEKLSFQSARGKKGNGFTLIELMIVVVIAAILAAIAYPLYTHYVGKSRRSAAITALQRAAALEEKYYALHNTYAVTLTSVGYASNAVKIPSPQKDWYTLAASSASATGYTLTATPTGAQNDDGCGTYTLKSTGERGVSKGDVSKCWGSG